MGYTTEFDGEFTLDRPLTPERRRYLKAFAGTRRMKRDQAKAAKLEDPVRKAVDLPVGDEGGYVVPAASFSEDDGLEIDNFGQQGTPDVLNYNGPPAGQPGLWCQWEPNKGGTAIEWNGSEKFYSYVEWLRYLIHHFLAPWGHTLNGEVTWQGEESGDMGKIVVTDNEVTVKPGRVVYED